MERSFTELVAEASAVTMPGEAFMPPAPEVTDRRYEGDPMQLVVPFGGELAMRIKPGERTGAGTSPKGGGKYDDANTS